MGAKGIKSRMSAISLAFKGERENKLGTPHRLTHVAEPPGLIDALIGFMKQHLHQHVSPVKWMEAIS